MSTSTHTSNLATHHSDSDTARRALVPTAVVSTAITMAFSYLGAHDTREAVVEIGVQLVAAGLLFAVVVPRGLRHDSAGGRGIALALFGLLLLVPAFWLGLPLQLGAAAALLGYAGMRADNGSGKAIASLVIGVLGVVAYLAVYASDFVNTHVIG